MIGLFVNHAGRDRNLPIARFGNISMMPNEKVSADLGGLITSIEAYLVECRSIGGLSGSPVFVHLGPFRRKHDPPNPLTDVFYLLGLTQGHWNQSIDSQHDCSVHDSSNVLSDEAVNKGVAIVTPISKVVEIINQDEMLDKRNKTIERIKQDKK